MQLASLFPARPSPAPAAPATPREREDETFARALDEERGGDLRREAAEAPTPETGDDAGSGPRAEAPPETAAEEATPRTAEDEPPTGTEAPDGFVPEGALAPIVGEAEIPTAGAAAGAPRLDATAEAPGGSATGESSAVTPLRTGITAASPEAPGTDVARRHGESQAIAPSNPAPVTAQDRTEGVLPDAGDQTDDAPSKADGSREVEARRPTAPDPETPAPLRTRFDRLRTLTGATDDGTRPEPVPAVRREAAPTAPEPAAVERSTGEARPVETVASDRSSETGRETPSGRQDDRRDRGHSGHGEARPAVEAPAQVASRPAPTPAGDAAPAAFAGREVAGPVAASRPTPAAPSTAGRAALDARTVDRIHDQLRLELSPRRPELTVRLDPPELGRLHVRLSLERGTLVARIEAERAEVARAFENDVGRLIRTLEDAGMKVGAVDVRQEAATHGRSEDFAGAFARSGAQDQGPPQERAGRGGSSSGEGAASAASAPAEPGRRSATPETRNGRERALDLVI